MLSFKTLTAFVALAASASAHTIFQQIYVNGVSPGHLKGIRYTATNGPLVDVSTNDIICNGGPNPLVQPIAPDVIPVTAGDTITAEWHHNLNGNDPSNPDDPIGSSHKGPVIVYLAKVDDAKTPTVTGLKWFKIYEDGYDASTGTWAVDKLIAARGKHSFTIPKCIANGDYLLRAEIIALHAAASYPAAQFYVGCGQIRVSGATGTATPATVSFPGAYVGSHPGITINIYYPPIVNYPIPGPAVFTCGGTNPPPSSTSTRTLPSSTSTSTRVSSTSTRSSSSSSSSSRPSSSSSASGGSPLWGQCGGIGWSGPTTCAQGTCVKNNDFYSQCIP